MLSLRRLLLSSGRKQRKRTCVYPSPGRKNGAEHREGRCREGSGRDSPKPENGLQITPETVPPAGVAWLNGMPENEKASEHRAI